MTEQSSWRYPSSSSDKVYTVQRRVDGLVSCDCPGWVVKRAGRPRSCKHTKQVVVALGLPVDARDDGEFVGQGGAVATPAPAPRPEPAAPRSPPGVAPTYRPLMLADEPTTPGDGGVRPPFPWADYPASDWQMETKFDGERALVAVRSGVVTAWHRAGRDANGDTRDGLPWTLAPQIVAVMARLPDGDYDGEVVVANGRSSDARRFDNAHALRLVIFDALALLGRDITGLTYTERRAALEVVSEILGEHDPVLLAANGDPDRATYDAIVAAGGEGVILKHRSSKYTGKRSSQWVKVKARHEAVVTIVGFEEGKNGPTSVVVFRMESGVESKAKVLNADWHRRIKAGEIAAGARMEIEYQVLMPSGKPRHPMCKRIVGDA